MGGYILRSYPRAGSRLTALFSEGACVGLHAPYPSVLPQRAALQTLAAPLYPAATHLARLVFADSGWLLVTHVRGVVDRLAQG